MQAQNQKLAERYIIPIVREVARGLAGIHEAGIIHRDIKGGRSKQIILVVHFNRLTNMNFGQRQMS